jgi:hypothetical protein
MAGSCVGNYFLIILLLILFGLVYIYVDNRKTIFERFSSCQQQLNQQQKQQFIIPQEQLAIVQGVNVPEIPISAVQAFDNDPSASTIDGDPNSPSQMFMFSNNKASLDCCPSIYSTSKGCVCMTDQQINWLSQRGNNNRFSKCDGPRDI